jgi:branched-chain amino acid transport system permease protein
MTFGGNDDDDLGGSRLRGDAKNGRRHQVAREDPALGLLLTFGLAMVAEQALRWIYGAAPIPFSIPPALKGQLLVGDFIYSKYRLLMLGVAASAVAALWLLLQRTPFGRVVIRAR